jgi:hypothetical protein
VILSVLVLAVPVLIALLVWWLRYRSTGRYGRSLPVFLFGYAIALLLNGVTSSVHDRGHSSSELSEYVLLVLSATIVSYILGGVGWLTLVALKEPLLNALSYWLKADERGNEAVRSERETAGEDLRQRAIEECAEEAYGYLIENEGLRAADHDRTERIAARLRDAILALGQKD